MQHPRRAAGRAQRRQGIRIARAKALRLTRGEPPLDRQRPQLQLAPQALGDRLEHLIQIGFAQQADHVVQDDGLALALLGLLRPLALARRELARDRRRQQEEQQREPLLRIGHGELVDWLDEEPVEDQKSQNGGEDGRPATEPHRGSQHSQQVQHRDIGQVDG